MFSIAALVGFQWLEIKRAYLEMVCLLFTIKLLETIRCITQTYTHIIIHKLNKHELAMYHYCIHILISCLTPLLKQQLATHTTGRNIDFYPQQSTLVFCMFA